ncbi:MAG: periplasmic sensor signal transduction histidine kinase [Thermomicrobiales bacterium]|jgi:two-component system sensor histidine kinase VicK|nr:periplasmic sensor signal transduction histidine kinase [Thermomicrobiales bacterium]
MASPHAWRLVAVLIGALLAVVVAGVLSIVENNRAKLITERALSFDVAVEDEAADVHIAMLELGHVHRNIVFSSISESTIAEFDEASASLLEELSELDSLGLADMGITQPVRIRELAERYYADFLPAVESAEAAPDAFHTASDVGLARLSEMGVAADQMDNLGDRLADDSPSRVQGAISAEQAILFVLVAGALLIGVAMAIFAGRILTRLHMLYEREQQSRTELARALQTKTDFIADASHELRTPLAVILGNAETALASKNPGLHETSLAAIAAETRRMGKLVDDILFLARSDAGSPPLEREYVPARWLVTRLVKPAGVLARQRASCLSDQIGGEGYLEVDPERIEQAVLILVDNAARHSPTGSCVSLTSRVDGGYLTIEVADSGSGIHPEELPHIFDRSYQVKNRRSRKKGSAGLGLSIARTIVAAHGDSITAQSALGAGTRMTIRLPLAAPPEAMEEPAPEPRRVAAG